MSEVHHIYKNHGPVKFLLGKNKLLSLSFENFLYKRINGKFPNTTWRCVSGCPATVTTFNGIFQTASPLNDHIHPPPTDEIIVTETKMKIKSRVETEFHLSPRQIHMQERTKLLLRKEDTAHLALGPYSKARSNLYKYRKAKFPKGPQNRREIEMNGDWKLTLDNSETFLLADDGLDDRILIFGTDNNLRILCSGTYVISDGTFSVHPEIFSQLYVFHGPCLGKVLPLLFCLLPDKTYITYCRLIKLIESAATKIGCSFRPQKIHIDYEASMIKAVCEIFSKDVVQGCLFHYSQSIWRKVQELGVSVAYKHDKDVRRWIRRFSALPFLPLCDIDEGFLTLHENFPIPSSDTVNIEQINKFHDYIVNTWVHDTDATFDRILWNQYDNDGPRTTNNAEGWNHKLNMLAKSRLSFFEFVHFLQGLQVDLDTTKFDLISNSPSRQSTKCRNVNDIINVAKQNYASGNVSILQYLDSVSIALKLD